MRLFMAPVNIKFLSLLSKEPEAMHSQMKSFCHWDYYDASDFGDFLSENQCHVLSCTSVNIKIDDPSGKAVPSWNSHDYPNGALSAQQDFIWQHARGQCIVLKHIWYILSVKITLPNSFFFAAAFSPLSMIGLDDWIGVQLEDGNLQSLFTQEKNLRMNIGLKVEKFTTATDTWCTW